MPSSIRPDLHPLRYSHHQPDPTRLLLSYIHRLAADKDFVYPDDNLSYTLCFHLVGSTCVEMLSKLELNKIKHYANNLIL